MQKLEKGQASMKKKKIKLGDLTIDIVVYAALIAITIIMLYPVWYVLMASITTSSEVARSGGILFGQRKSLPAPTNWYLIMDD